ncbi:MAG: hypothetical protein JF625_18265 [Inquilinus limosus]|uniref:Peptidase M10 serralysin C-terminal domain-containing protein n=1 Tax=Inquilinus limosus TaxID=171674 RepID=A0A952FMH8_9PROT|nr:hypothetical protein [Inquilinus limosus]
MEAGDGNDEILGDLGSDRVYGDTGNDRIFGEGGNDQLTGAEGDDLLVGGAGADRLSGGTGVDTVDYSASAAAVQVSFALAAGPGIGGDAEGDTYSEIENIIGSRYADTLSASGVGSGGALTGGLGVDTMRGGTGVNLFIYQSTADTGLGAGKRDMISDFDGTEGDRIDLSRIDADPLTAGDQAFTFVGRTGFTGKGGEVGYRYSGDQVIVSIDLDGKNGADIEIQISLPGQILPPMYATDFVL